MKHKHVTSTTCKHPAFCSEADMGRVSTLNGPRPGGLALRCRAESSEVSPTVMIKVI